MRALLLAVLLAFGCNGLIPPNYPARDECREMDTNYLVFRSLAIGMGGAAGALGGGGIINASLNDDSTVDAALAGASGGAGILSSVFSFLADFYADRVVRCGEVEP